MVKISYAYKKHVFLERAREREKKKSPIIRILLFHSEHFFCKIRRKNKMPLSAV